jgi:hypothetical protein
MGNRMKLQSVAKRLEIWIKEGSAVPQGHAAEVLMHDVLSCEKGRCDW